MLDQITYCADGVNTVQKYVKMKARKPVNLFYATHVVQKYGEFRKSLSTLRAGDAFVANLARRLGGTNSLLGRSMRTGKVVNTRITVL